MELNCANYGVAQSRLQPVFIGLARGQPNELQGIVDRVKSMASTRRTVVSDVIDVDGDYFALPPSSSRRGIYPVNLPAPRMCRNHWRSPWIPKYIPCITDPPGVDIEDCVKLLIPQFARLQGLPEGYIFPEHGRKTRQELVASIVDSVPPQIVCVVTTALLPLLLAGRPKSMDRPPDRVEYNLK